MLEGWRTTTAGGSGGAAPPPQWPATARLPTQAGEGDARAVLFDAWSGGAAGSSAATPRDWAVCHLPARRRQFRRARGGEVCGAAGGGGGRRRGRRAEAARRAERVPTRVALCATYSALALACGGGSGGFLTAADLSPAAPLLASWGVSEGAAAALTSRTAPTFDAFATSALALALEPLRDAAEGGDRRQRRRLRRAARRRLGAGGGPRYYPRRPQRPAAEAPGEGGGRK